MNNSTVRKIVVLLITVCCASAVFAEDGVSIIQKSLDVKRPRFTHSALKMTVVNSAGEKDERMIEEWAKDPGDKTGAAVIVFRQPSSVKDTRFLQIVNKDRPNDKWIYLPALRTVRRIAGTDGSKSFLDTDADYDDLETRKIDQDTHTLAGGETVADYECWKVESVPVDAKSGKYSKKIV